MLQPSLQDCEAIFSYIESSNYFYQDGLFIKKNLFLYFKQASAGDDKPLQLQGGEEKWLKMLNQ